ncbi:hypothetical protein JR316_0004517 [Psilocybe cubensis]|uniref:Uncharacterized protein n=2 Tax=Psilocybe cubensis TaxID=181762 RepID=A0ACB8H454_PSICU|nr:hypothetical protein JR316_0004517 [Psilocybe cubensis]KAH9482417.1 hypothetical protein JR316_0004517 [Psilocybe cubensis]
MDFRVCDHDIVVQHAFNFAERGLSTLSVKCYSEIESLEHSSAWSIPKMLYLLIRYSGLFTVVINATVASTVQQSVKTQHFRCQLFAWFLVTMLYALYNRDKRVLIFLVFLNTFHLAIQIYVLVVIGISSAQTTFLAPPGIPLPGCPSNPAHKDSCRGGVWVVIMLVGGILNSNLASGPLTLLYLPWNIVVYVLAATGLIIDLRRAASTERSLLGMLETAIAYYQTQELVTSTVMMDAFTAYLCRRKET